MEEVEVYRARLHRLMVVVIPWRRWRSRFTVQGYTG